MSQTRCLQTSPVTLAVRDIEKFGSGAFALSFGTCDAITGVAGDEYITEASATMGEYE